MHYCECMLHINKVKKKHMKKAGIKRMKKTLLTRLVLLKLPREAVCVLGLGRAEPAAKAAKTNSVPPIPKLEAENNRIVRSGV